MMMTSLYPTQVTVDLGAIRHNYREIRQIVPKEQDVLCVIKSNAYGHGIKEVGAALAREGASFFGVRDIGEGKALRQAGVKAPILLLLGIIDEAFEDIVRHSLIPVIFDLKTARVFNRYLELHQTSHPVHVKIDTGMTRLGVPADQVPFFMGKLKELRFLQVAGILSHLADATDIPYTTRQKEAWDQVRHTLAPWKIPLWHFSNSIGAVQSLFPATDMVRAGIVLYGSYPDPEVAKKVSLKPALRWTTEVLDLKTVPAGTSISYGCTYTTERPSRIAVLPVGYADGYSRLLSNRGQVLVRGQRVPVVGRVCMDLTMIDVTDIPEIDRGERITLLGNDGDEQISAEEVADWADTISYEVLASIAVRVPRRYKE